MAETIFINMKIYIAAQSSEGIEMRDTGRKVAFKFPNLEAVNDI